MNRIGSYKSKPRRKEAFDVVLLFLVGLVFLTAGNILYHSRIVPIKEGVAERLRLFITRPEDGINITSAFLLSVIFAARGDILCVWLIAFSNFTKIPRLFTYCVFSCRSFLFGFCGACLIRGIDSFGSFWQGTFAWILFFVYHIVYFSILICFGEATLRRYDQVPTAISRLQYMLTVFAESALVVLINAVYYFLISKI